MGRAASKGGCDLAGVCNGTTSGCPGDTIEPVGTDIRRMATDLCDVTELCQGSAACPSDAVASAGTVCRPAGAHLCDVDEVCDGSAKSCPPDQVVPAGTTCHESTPNGCDTTTACDGINIDCPSVPVGAGTSCIGSERGVQPAGDLRRIEHDLSAAELSDRCRRRRATWRW